MMMTNLYKNLGLEVKNWQNIIKIGNGMIKKLCQDFQPNNI